MWNGPHCFLIIAPLLSAIHIYSVVEEMRAAPVNTLNPQRTAMIVADFFKTGKVSSPVDLRYRENLLFPDRIIEEAGNVKMGKPFHKVVESPSKFEMLRTLFPDEKFLIRRKNKQHTEMILENSASGEDALRGWLAAAFCKEGESAGMSEEEVMGAAYGKMKKVFPSFLSEVKSRGWYTDQFLDGNGSRFAL